MCLHDVVNAMGCHVKTKEDAMKAVLRGKFKAKNAYTRKKYSIINFLSFYLRKL